MTAMRRADVLWLAGQGVLFLLAFVALPLTDGLFGRLDVPGERIVGSAIFVVGAVIGVVAILQLGRQAVPQPTPVQGGQLIDTGVYGMVRHPIYTAVLLLIAGSVVRVLSVAGLVLIAISVVFFDRKIAYEEHLLCDAYPGYEDYRRRVRWRLLPGLR